MSKLHECKVSILVGMVVNRIRGVGALLGPQLYALGFWANMLAAAGFNGLAFAALRRVKEDE